MFDFAKEMISDLRGQCKKFTRDRSFIKLIKSPAIMASGISKTIFLSSDPNELFNRLTRLQPEKHRKTSWQ